MGLPKIDLPIFELTLPSTGEKVKYRQYRVKEEKILLVAQESKDPLQEVLAIKQVVNNCLIDKDVSELAMMDLEYIQIALRSRSVDNQVTFSITDPDTKEKVELAIDIDNITVTRNESHSNKIKINDEWMLFLRYPTIDEFMKIVGLDPTDPLINYFIMVSCLDKIASEDEVYDFKDYSDEQIDEFMGDLSTDIIAGIQNFFETMPRLRHEIKYTNSNGDDKTFVIEGLRTFFT